MKDMRMGKYRHHKGKMYLVTGIAKHSETLEEFVTYICLYDNPSGQMWIRPKKMFLEKILVNGKKVPRFEHVGK